MTKISIFLLSRSLEVGGAERQLVALAKGLSERGNSVTIALFYRTGDLLSELEGTDVRVVDLRKTGRWDLAGFLGRTIAAVRQAKPDIIYGMLGSGNLMASVIRPLARGALLVWSVRGTNRRLNAYDRVQKLSYWLECRVANSPDLIIANSSAGRDYSVRNGFPSDKFVIIPNGIDTSRFRPVADLREAQRRSFGFEPRDVVVGMLSRVEAVKAHRDFLNAARIASAEAPNLRFLCVGGGPDFEAMQRFAAELGLEGLIRFVGQMDPVAALNAFDIACSCSHSEGFSNSIAEAMACGLPSIVTDVGDSAWIVGETGIVVPPASPETLARAMVDQAARLSEHRPEIARARVIENFSVDAMVERNLDAFRKLL